MAQVNQVQITKVAEVFRKLAMPTMSVGPGKSTGLEFCDPSYYPPIGHPEVVNFFFFWVLQNHGFWYGDDCGYVAPLYGIFDGKARKGADLLSLVLMKAFQQDPARFRVKALTKISPAEFISMFCNDNGPVPFPDIESRYKITHAYARYFTKILTLRGFTAPEELLQAANEVISLDRFLARLSLVPGFQDPLRKKSLLLAMVFSSRPEKFLRVELDAIREPIVDYHLMRIALRLGLVELDAEEEKANRARHWVDSKTEKHIRGRVYQAVSRLISRSGLTMPVIDEKLWMARRYCPELDTPDCPKCVFNAVCKKSVELFQPVYRTMNY